MAYITHKIAPDPIASISLTAEKGYRQHAYFAQAYSDLHARPFPIANSPLRASHLCFLHDKTSGTETELNLLSQLCLRYSVNPPPDNASCFYQQLGNFEIRWERHTEFSSYTFLIQDAGPEPFAVPPISLIPNDWLALLPGKLISAVHVEVMDLDEPEIDKDKLRQCFEGHRLIGSILQNGDAKIFSALRLHHDNFNRVLVLNKALNHCQTGRVLRALLEIEAYRNMTLVAFPLAQNISAQVSEMEGRLAELLRVQNEILTSQGQREQLAHLSKMAADIATLIAESRYRFDASIAYYEMVNSRFDELKETEIRELQTLSGFIERRLSPAIRTVIACKRRLDDLVSRVDRASDFIRTRIDMEIESQNQALLKSMNKRAKMQFNLQQTVESLSVIVISYYILSLNTYILDGVELFNISVNRHIYNLVALPCVVVLVWVFLRRLKRKIDRS